MSRAVWGADGAVRGVSCLSSPLAAVQGTLRRADVPFGGRQLTRAMVILLLDKTGGKKFSKEFEEASSKLEEFVNGLDKQVKNGPSLTEALENAGIFYEAQYKEVKVVANVSVIFLSLLCVD